MTTDKWNYKYLFGFILGVLWWLLTNQPFWSIIGICLSITIFVDLIKKIGYSIPIPEIIVFIAALQWIVGPLIDYGTPVSHFKYKMYVDAKEYMSYIVPSVMALLIGIKLFTKDVKIILLKKNIQTFFHTYPKIPIILVLIGIIAPLGGYFLPNSLLFILFLLSQFKYIGALYFILSEHPLRWYIFSGLMITSMTTSIINGMFHDILLWGILTISFIFYELKFSFLKKLVFMIIGAIIVITIQAVKSSYREQSSTLYSNNQKLELYFDLVKANWKDGQITTPINDNDINTRINQGWIISAIMKNVPDNRPFDNGTSIKEAIEAALIPRVLNPNKKHASGRENFMKYTGLPLGQHTSMGISLAGEGWANFGHLGGIIFLFIWGSLIGIVWKKLSKMSNVFPTLMIWTPIIFLQVVKAESELLTVLNHLIKSSILVFGFLWYFLRFHNIRI